MGALGTPEHRHQAFYDQFKDAHFSFWFWIFKAARSVLFSDIPLPLPERQAEKRDLSLFISGSAKTLDGGGLRNPLPEMSLWAPC